VIRVLEFTASDVQSGPQVAVISRATADRYWPGGDALGSRISVFATERTIVGIVGDVRHLGPTTPVDPMVYIPHQQDVLRRSMTIVLRSGGDGATLLPAARAALREIDAHLPISNIRSFDDLRSSRTAAERFTALLVTAFGTLAGLLAGVGIFGVMSFAVAQRKREIGVRMALGADRVSVLSRFMIDALRAAVPGAIIGALLALPLARLARSLLFGVTPADPVTFVGAVLLVIAVALGAAAIPALRAASVDPRVALIE
jgi:hypothetical protein